MFWTDWTKIERADLSGENRQTVVRLENRVFPMSLVIDFKAERIYWMTSGEDIQSADFNGNNTRMVPFGIGYAMIDSIDLALYGDSLYWVDRNCRSILWFNITHPSIIHSYGHLTDGYLVGAVVSDESRQPTSKNTIQCILL